MSTGTSRGGSSAHDHVRSAVTDGWMEGGSFFGSILSGTLIGYFADQFFGTDPWLVVIGVTVGAYSGFLRVWHYSAKMLDRR